MTTKMHIGLRKAEKIRIIEKDLIIGTLPISYNTYLIIDVKISVSMSNNKSPITVRHPSDTSTSTVERQSNILNLLHHYRHPLKLIY